MKSNKKFRDQVADLILTDDAGNNLVVVSAIENNEDGSISFVVGENSPDGSRYKVSILIEEI